MTPATLEDPGTRRADGGGRPDLRLLPRDRWAAALHEYFSAGLPGFLNCEMLELRPGHIEARLPLRDDLLRTAGESVHGGTVVAFADSCAGWGCLATLPDDANGFTTIELKTNFVATAWACDALHCTARLLHGGRRTQIWDADVTRERDGRNVAHTRVTQYLLANQR
jgi:1,4-dihydroxy-2-naphthoyl-CoA hydrolase